MIIRHRTFLAICIAIAALPAVPAAKPAPEPITVGPFHLGMTFAEARAAAPQLAWLEGTIHNQPYRKVMRAPDALEIGGLRYGVHLEPGWYGAYTLMLFRNTPADKPEVCAQAEETLIAGLESRFGAFAAGYLRTEHDRTARLVEDVRKKASTRRAGKASHYFWLTTPSFSEASAIQRRGEVELLAHSAFAMKSLPDEWDCETVLYILVPGHAPARETIPESRLKPDLTPSIGVLHNTVEQVEFPRGGFSVTSECEITRESGEVSCKGNPEHPKGVGAAVAARTYHLAFAVDSLEPGNPVPLYSTLTFRFEPTQRLSLGSPTNFIDERTVSWSNERTKPEPLPVPATDEDFYEHGTVTVPCKIQADGSLACADRQLTLADGKVADAALTKRFLFDAQIELQYRRAAPQLADGTPSAGRWVSIALPLRVMRLREQMK